jgi:hypothetical protein
MNLLEETLDVLKENNKTESDVLWVGSEDYGYFNWEDFKELASQECKRVATDLVVVGKDFWLERYIDNVSEWWEFKHYPKKPKIYKKPMSIDGDFLWGTLKELNR